MSHFYFFPSPYSPNTAATNRGISYIKGFSELGYNVNVVYFRPNSACDKNPYSYENVKIYHYWSRYISKIRILQYVSMLFFLVYFLIKLRKGDVVYCYNNVEVWLPIVKWRKSVRVFVEYTEHPEVVGIGGRFLVPSMENFYKYLSKVCGLFVITTSLRDFFISKGVDSRKIHIANITVDESRFENVKKFSNTESYIAYCGTLSNNKDGVDLLIKSFSIVHSVCPNIKLFIIGAAVEQDELNSNMLLINKMGLKDSVVLTGVVSASDMPQLLKNATILVLNRPDNVQSKNGFATKLGEYLLSENPVVVTSVGDIPLFLTDGISAYLAPPGNSELFAEKIIYVLNHIEEALHVGRNGAEVARKEFSYLVVTKKICNIIFSV